MDDTDDILYQSPPLLEQGEPAFIEDGFGNSWFLCKPECRVQIVRPGKVQCDCQEEAGC